MSQQEYADKLLLSFGTTELALKCINELLRLVEAYYITSGYKDMRDQMEFLKGAREKLSK